LIPRALARRESQDTGGAAEMLRRLFFCPSKYAALMATLKKRCSVVILLSFSTLGPSMLAAPLARVRQVRDMTEENLHPN
jgi:hypothetical protein